MVPSSSLSSSSKVENFLILFYDSIKYKIYHLHHHRHLRLFKIYLKFIVEINFITIFYHLHRLRRRRHLHLFEILFWVFYFKILNSQSIKTYHLHHLHHHHRRYLHHLRHHWHLHLEVKIFNDL